MKFLIKYNVQILKIIKVSDKLSFRKWHNKIKYNFR